MKDKIPTVIIGNSPKNSINDYIKIIYEALNKHESIVLSGSLYSFKMMEELCAMFKRLNCNIMKPEMGHIKFKDEGTTPTIRFTIEKTNLFDFSDEFPKWYDNLKP